MKLSIPVLHVQLHLQFLHIHVLKAKLHGSEPGAKICL